MAEVTNHPGRGLVRLRHRELHAKIHWAACANAVRRSDRTPSEEQTAVLVRIGVGCADQYLTMGMLTRAHNAYPLSRLVLENSE